MSSNPSVAAAKRDLSYMLSILGIQSSKTTESNAPCPFCGDKTCLNFGPDKKHLGDWYWNCNKGCGNGNVVKAIQKLNGWENDDGWKQAYDKIEKDFGGRVPKQSAHDKYHKERQAELRGHSNGTQNGVNPHGYIGGVVPTLRGFAQQLPAPSEPRPPEPVIDLDKANAFVDEHHAYLMRNFELVTKWGRGLSREVCERRRIGFVEFGKVQFKPWTKEVQIPAAWVIPVTNEDNEIKGVKIHFEERPMWGDKKCPKLLWMPFGTTPEAKRIKDDQGRWVETSKTVHAYITMYPHPATLTQTIVSDFSLDASFWIERIPAEMRPEWEIIKEAKGLEYAYELGKVPEELDGPEAWTVNLRAFEEVKQKIFKAVLKQVDAIEKYDKNSKKRDVDWSSYVFVCPGELKALACESAGMMATASTMGEGKLPHSSFLSKFAGQNVCLFGDEDPAKRSINHKDPTMDPKIILTAKDWVDKWTDALYAHGANSVVSKFGGVVERDQE